MKDVLGDTSALYAALDGSDAFHRRAASLLRQAETEGWRLITTNYIVQESWALLQNRLGWEAV